MKNRILLAFLRHIGIRQTEDGKPAIDPLLFGGWIGSGRWLATIVTGVLILIFLAGLLPTVFRSEYFSPVATVDEQLMYYQAARTFNEYGFLNSYLLQDFSTSSNPAHHPFVYNHMPPGPEIFIALLTRVFGEQYRLIRLIFLVIFLVGLVCYFRFARLMLRGFNLTGEGFAILFIPPAVMFHMMDHPAYSPFPFLAFFPLVSLHSYYESGKRSQHYLALGVVFVSSIYLVYQQVLMLLVCWACLSAFRLIRFDRKELVTFYAVMLFGILAHLFQSLLFLGGATFLQELRFTVSNRMFGVPTTADLKDFYQAIGVVHQGTHPFDPVALLAAVDRSLLSPGRHLLTQLGLAFVAFVILRGFVRNYRIDRGLLVVEDSQFREMVSRFACIGIWLLATNAVPLLVFPAYSANYQLSGANYLFLAIGIIAAIGYIVRETFVRRPNEILPSLRSSKSRGGAAVWLALTLSIVVFAVWQAISYGMLTSQATARMLASDPHRQLPEIMRALEGKVVMTNVYPSIASFFTREATFGGCELAAFPTERFNHLFNGGFEDFNFQGNSPLHWTVAASDIEGNEVSPSEIFITKESADVPQGTTSVRMIVPENVTVDYQQWATLPRQPETYEVTGAMLVKTAVRDRTRVYLREAGQRLLTFSDYHPGDGMWHLLTVKSIFPSNVISARSVEFGLNVASGGQQLQLG